MALCPACDRVIPCSCHVAPPVQVRPGVYLTENRHPAHPRPAVESAAGTPPKEA